MDNAFKKEWTRIEFDNTPIYTRPGAPDWFVPNPSADQAMLSLMTQGKNTPELDPILQRLDLPLEPSYSFRTELLELDQLKECWLHITNQCNMECRHCMFRSSPKACDQLSQETCSDIIEQAYALGCRVFYFTGGEPMISPAFFQSVQEVLGLADTNVVVLTNLTLMGQKQDAFKNFPKDRLHFQVSVDGIEGTHDHLRGKNAFERLKQNLNTLNGLGFPATLSMTVTRENITQMTDIIEFASKMHVSNVHYLWLFQKGNADAGLYVEPGEIFPCLAQAQKLAETKGIKIDNIEILRSQVFSCPGTRFDLSNAGWQSLAVGPDGQIYPTPAMVYTRQMACGHISQGLETVWRKSQVLEQLRATSLNSSPESKDSPLAYIIGGGDIDHSYIHGGRFSGRDPYIPLYTDIAKWLMTKDAGLTGTGPYPALCMRMGEQLGDCPQEGTPIFFTHSNCVLSLPGHDNRSRVNQFYSKAAQTPQEDILNPVCYEEDLIRHIPEEMRYRSYGCGSPVLEAGVKTGETVVDLGSGTGIECFIAGKLAGPGGRAIGIDMGDAMLAVAGKTKKRVVENLTYDNIEFKKSFLETLPFEDNSVDLIISNCVLNLSPDKRRVFSEIFRVLKPHGRMVISDITYTGSIPLQIKYNETLRGECIGGALAYHDLFGLINDIGFSQGQVLKGYLYRQVKGHDFYSITYQAVKPVPGQQPELYTFPGFAALMAEVKSEPTCACFVKPEPAKPSKPAAPGSPFNPGPLKSGCLVCGADLVYSEVNQQSTCHYCGQTLAGNARCANGHFVCDTCHRTDAVDIIRQVCLHSSETDATALMQTIRSHPHFGIHGPEHHSLVPAVLLTALRNLGHDITDGQISTAIERGQTVAGGACAFLGVCGAAVGVGIAFSVLQAATPYTGDKRQNVQQVTHQILGQIAEFDAPRCCQRDCWIALSSAVQRLARETGKTISVSPIACDQYPENKECIHARCPLWPKNQV